MSRRLRIHVFGMVVALAVAAATAGVVVPACSFSAVNLQGDDGGAIFDAAPDVALPDAAPCEDPNTRVCVQNVALRACTQTGQLPTDTICDWGCIDEPPQGAHCRRMVPSGGAVSVDDADPLRGAADALEAKTIQGNVTFNTETGAISNTRGAGVNVVANGIHFQIKNGVGIWRFDALTMSGSGTIKFTGVNAAALVAMKTLAIRDEILVDLRGTCSGTAAGPGGKSGGNADQNGSGMGAGGGGAAVGGGCSGGGGAGFGRGGNGGGNAVNGGGSYGSGAIAVLVGGSGGGGGGTGGGTGGGGGGALQLVANGAITLDGDGFPANNVRINAGGCGGAAGTCGGGGGAGGALLIEGRTVDLRNVEIAANGGGGGGGGGGSDGSDGATNDRANGGAGATPVGPNNDGGDGGDGGYYFNFVSNGGAEAGGVRDQRGGGGGGGVGWIRVNTRSGELGTSGAVSMSPATGQPSSSKGAVIVQ